MSLLSPKYTCTRCRFMSDDMDTTIPCTSPNGHLWNPSPPQEYLDKRDTQWAIRHMLRHLPGITQEVLDNTPNRFLKAFKEMTQGYDLSPKEVLGTIFEEEGCDEIVILKDIPFVSLCIHHLLPFIGTVDIGYLPSSVPGSQKSNMSMGRYRIVGLSKLARLVDCISQRLQIQETMTRQIAEAIMDEPMSAQGVAVVVRGNHSCVACRGVKKSGSVMCTSSMLGIMRGDEAARAEFLSLCRST